MELILSFKHAPFIEKSATYEIGSGKNHFLSFYFLGYNHRLLVNSYVVFADVVKCVDDVEDISLEEEEYDFGRTYDYVFSEVLQYDFFEFSEKNNLISFDVDRTRRAGLDDLIFNVFNNGRRRGVDENNIYRLKDRFDNGVTEDGIFPAFKDEKSVIENDGGNFIDDKEDEDGIIENHLIKITKDGKVFDKLKDTLARKVTDYGVNENGIIKIRTEIKDLLYDKFQKMLDSTSNDIIINKTMLVDMGNYRELLQNKDVRITTTDNKTHRIENKYLKRTDSLLEEVKIGMLVGGQENKLLVDNSWRLYSQENGSLYIYNLEKELAQDIYSKPILNFDLDVLGKHDSDLNVEKLYINIYKRDIELDCSDTVFSGTYRDSSNITIKDDYLFMFKDVQDLLASSNHIALRKTIDGAEIIGNGRFAEISDRKAHVIENKYLNKIENRSSINSGEKFLFHPLDGSFIIDTSKWFTYGRELYTTHNGFLVYNDHKSTELNKKDIFLGTMDDDYKLYILNHFLVSGEDKLGHINDPVKSLTKFDKGAVIDYVDLSIYSYSGELDFISTMFIGKYNKDLNLDYGQMLIEKYYHRTVDGFKSICFEVTQRYTDSSKDDIWISKKIREMYKNTSIIMTSRDNKKADVDKIVSVRDTVRYIFKYDNDTFGKVTSKYVDMSPIDLLVDVTSKSIKEEYSIMELYKIENSLSSSLDEIQVSRESYGFNVNEDFMWIDKGPIGIGMNELYSVEASKDSRRVSYVSNIFADRPAENNRELNIDFEYTMADKYPRDTVAYSSSIGFSKYPRSTAHEYDNVWASKDAYKTSTIDTTKSLYRINNELGIIDTIFGLFKGYRKVDSDMRSIQISKVYKDIFIDTIEEFVYRDFIKEIEFNKDTWFKMSYRDIENANDHTVNLKKVSRDVYENNTVVGLLNNERCLFEDSSDKQFDIAGRALFENNLIVNFTKDYTPLFEDTSDVMFEKVNVRISTEDNDELGITKESYTVMTYDTYSWIHKVSVDLHVNEAVGAGGVTPDSRKVFYNDSVLGVDKYAYETHIDNNGVFADNKYRELFENDNSLGVIRDSYNTHIDFEYTEVYKTSRDVQTYKTYTGAIKTSKTIGSQDTLVGAVKTPRDIGSIGTYMFADKLYRDICRIDQPVFSSKSSKVIGYIENGIFADKFSRDTLINNAWELVSKTNIDIDINESISSISKISKEISTEYDGVISCKNSKNIYIDTLEEFLNRDFDPDGNIRIGATIFGDMFVTLGNKKIVLPYKHVLIGKCIRDSHIEYSDLWFDKKMHHFMIGYENLFIGKAMHHSMIGYEDLFLGKSVFHFNDLPVGVGVTKYSKDFDTFKDNLWINKSPKETGINKDFKWIKKGYRDSFFSEHHVWIDKDAKKFNINYEFIWADKYNKDVFVSYSYSLAQKDRKHTNIEYNNIFMDKIEKNGSFIDLIYIDKADIHSHINDNLFVGMSMKHAKFSTADDPMISHEDKYGKINAVLFINQPLKRGKIMKNISLFEHRAKGNILEQEFLYLPIHNTNIDEVEFLYKPLSDVHINEDITLREPDMNTYIDNNLYVNQYVSDSYIFNTEWINQDLKNANLTQTEELVDQEHKEFQVEYKNMFVYHVSGDDGSKPDIERSGIIDELILPHKDYKYSDYLKKLILPDGSINMMYVKSFDSDTGEYTVTLPIEHPLNVYTDIGRDYLDVDVAILNMTIHMLKEIWKQKMFRYIAMSAQDSLKDMLLELDKKIKYVYENDANSKKEARRCLQLFRWYSEMAILNNCEYILKFYGREVEVDFVEKDLKEIGNLIELDNMHISENFMLEPIDTSSPASVTFVNNQKNLGAPLNMSFKLYNINRNSSISIIDENVKNTNYKQGIHEVSIDIKKKAVIGFEPNGKYQSMVLTNLKANNYSTNNFSIKYKGIFGETNKVMQDLLDRLLVVGEVSDELKERLKDVSPVTVALDRLLTYFELHHEDKEKGRRLITRK